MVIRIGLKNQLGGNGNILGKLDMVDPTQTPM